MTVSGRRKHVAEAIWNEKTDANGEFQAVRYRLVSSCEHAQIGGCIFGKFKFIKIAVK